MNFRRKLLVVGAVALAGLVSMAGAAGAGGRPLSTDLIGAEEAPGPGDPNATGQIDLTLNQGQGEICFDLSWSDIDGTVNAAHIHLAPAGVAGGVVVWKGSKQWGPSIVRAGGGSRPTRRLIDGPDSFAVSTSGKVMA